MKTLFGKKRSAKSYPSPSAPFTAIFAKEILDLEEQVNLNCSLPVVTRLVNLYKKAIEYYEGEKNLKHIHYQERLQMLLGKTNVLQSLKLSNSPVPSPQSFSSNSPRNKQGFTELVIERNCEKVIKEHLVGNLDVAKRIQNNLRGQSENLNQRIMLRKIAHSPRYTKRFVFDESSTDRESGSNNPVEEFENEVEEILEKYMNDKKKDKKEIQEKYEEHFNETNLISGQMKQQLLQELQKNMNFEIQQALLEADTKRLDKVATAREKLNNRI